ncbi:MAG: hypothetical protein VB131_00550 [Burkholderia gladioli]
MATWRLEAPHRTLEWRRDWLGKLVAQRHGFGAWADGVLVGFGELAPQRLRRNHVGFSTCRCMTRCPVTKSAARWSRRC